MQTWQLHTAQATQVSKHNHTVYRNQAEALLTFFPFLGFSSSLSSPKSSSSSSLTCRQLEQLGSLAAGRLLAMGG